MFQGGSCLQMSFKGEAQCDEGWQHWNNGTGRKYRHQRQTWGVGGEKKMRPERELWHRWEAPVKGFLSRSKGKCYGSYEKNMLCGNAGRRLQEQVLLWLGSVSCHFPRRSLDITPKSIHEFQPESQQVGQTTAWLVVLHFSCCVVIIYLPASSLVYILDCKVLGFIQIYIFRACFIGWPSTLLRYLGVTVSTMYSVMYIKCPVCTVPFIDRSSRHFINIHWLKQEPIQWQQVASSNTEVLEKTKWIG